MVSLNVPNGAIRYILFQRTQYLRFPITPLYRHVLRHLPMTLPVYNVVVGIESRLSRERVKRLYAADMAAEYESIRTALPDRCASVLDIGCGVAGIDVFIDRHYGDQPPDFYLLDRTEVARRVYYLFEQRAAFYNSLEVASELLAANGIDRERVRLLEANERNEIAVAGRVDLVLSLLSWGFHYPVETYREPVRGLLSDSGVVILDVRRGTGGMEALQSVFERVDVIVEAEKYQRVAARSARSR